MVTQDDARNNMVHLSAKWKRGRENEGWAIKRNLDLSFVKVF
jgi:hypothetical protein